MMLITIAEANQCHTRLNQHKEQLSYCILWCLCRHSNRMKVQLNKSRRGPHLRPVWMASSSADSHSAAHQVARLHAGLFIYLYIEPSTNSFGYSKLKQLRLQQAQIASATASSNSFGYSKLNIISRFTFAVILWQPAHLQQRS